MKISDIKSSPKTSNLRINVRLKVVKMFEMHDWFPTNDKTWIN